MVTLLIKMVNMPDMITAEGSTLMCYFNLTSRANASEMYLPDVNVDVPLHKLFYVLVK